MNKNNFSRIIGENYSQSFKKDNGEEYKIEDPLKMSIRNFIESIVIGKSYMSKEEILGNVRMQDMITAKYLSQQQQSLKSKF